MRFRRLAPLLGLAALCASCAARQPETKPARPEIVPLTLEQEWEVGEAAR